LRSCVASTRNVIAIGFRAADPPRPCESPPPAPAPPPPCWAWRRVFACRPCSRALLSPCSTPCDNPPGDTPLSPLSPAPRCQRPSAPPASSTFRFLPLLPARAAPTGGVFKGPLLTPLFTAVVEAAGEEEDWCLRKAAADSPEPPDVPCPCRPSDPSPCA
jgi:hypothetical protein